MATLARCRVQVIALLAALLLAGGVAAAAPLVSDDGGFFTGETLSKLADKLADIQTRHTQTVVVKTFPSIPDSMRAAYNPQQKDAFFSQWLADVAKESGANIVILICRDPSHLQVGASRADRSSRIFTAADHQHVSQMLIAAFKNKEFDTGILQAADWIDQRLSQNTGNAGSGAAAGGNSGSSAPGYPPAPAPGPAPVGTVTHPTGGFNLLSIMCVVIAAVLLFVLVRGLTNRRPTGYGGYGGPMGGAPPGGAMPPGAGYGYGPPAGGGGGFGRGMLGGLLGGVLGGWAQDRFSHRGDQSSFPGAGNVPPGGAPSSGGGFDSSDPGPASSGGDFGNDSGSSGGTFDSGGGGGGDSGSSSSGGDF